MTLSLSQVQRNLVKSSVLNSSWILRIHSLNQNKSNRPGEHGQFHILKTIASELVSVDTKSVTFRIKFEKKKKENKKQAAEGKK